MNRIAYNDHFVRDLHDDIAALVLGERAAEGIEERLLELAISNSPEVARYWRSTGQQLGVPDVAFKDVSPYFFPDEPPARVFRTSGTTKSTRGHIKCSARGLRLKALSVRANARRRIARDGGRPIVIRFVPTELDAPEMAIAFDMQRISDDFGDPDLSTSVVTAQGVDYGLLIQRLDLAVAEGIPVLLAGGSFAFVNICDDLQSRGRSWQLPPGSQTVDGGGFKGRSRVVTVDALRQSVAEVFGIALDRCTNLFGMSELASQLYDSADVCAGPLGERPKSGAEFIRAIVRDPADLTPMPCGTGLLEIVDLCVLDRPHRILTGDSAIARDDGVVITGRIKGGQSRGCSLTLDEMTGGSDVRR